MKEDGASRVGKSSGKKPSKKRNLLRVAGQVVLILILLEIIGTVFFYREKYNAFMPNAFYYYQPKPGLKNFLISHRGGRVTTNINGFRSTGSTPKKPEGALRILCLGDSVTFGNVTQGDDETYPHFLQLKLDEMFPGKKIEVVNGGCPGYTCVQGLELLKRVGLSYEPDLIIVAFIHNDLCLAGMTDREVFSTPESIKIIRSCLYRSRFYFMLRRFIKKESLSASSPCPGRTTSRVTLEDYEGTMQEFVSITVKNRIELIILDLPVNREFTRNEPQYRASVRSIAKSNGIPFIDLCSLFNQYNKDDLMEDPVHPNPEGNSIMAEAIAEYIKASHIVTGFEKDSR